MAAYGLLRVDHCEDRGGTDAREGARELVTKGPPPRSFELAFDGLYRLAFRVAFRILGDRGDAEDVAQEALARALLRWSRLHEHPEGWVTRVASNLAIDRRRKRHRHSQIPVGPIGVLDEHDAEREDLVRALRRLPRRQREVVVMRYLADMSESEAAAALGCSVGTVKTHASRGLAALRRHLGLTDETGGDDVRAS
jgi:RNA polymerase sigma-70 factor (sigma-E family)